MLRPPVVIGDCPSTHNNIVCYQCGQTGHIKPNCPKLKGSVWIAAIHTEDVPDEGRNMEIEQEAPDEYQGEEQDDEYPATTQLVEETTDNWVGEPSPYNWDEIGRVIVVTLSPPDLVRCISHLDMGCQCAKYTV